MVNRLCFKLFILLPEGLSRLGYFWIFVILFILQEFVCIYILKCSRVGLVCLQKTLPPATGLVETYEVKEIKAQFNRSEVSCRQILDHECIEWMRSELNMNHLELGAFPGAQRTAGRVFTWLMRPWTQTLNPGPKPRHPKHRPWTQNPGASLCCFIGG